MFKREPQAANLNCPECGAALAQERDLLICKEHGTFFMYGTQLIVRAPGASSRPAEAPMPWDTQARRH
ncbi:hypothetical protein [Kouleothrix sp.]|uniref:hypothetical protein n=1 Tax=Kouleothrix sp. TaxID=2779161 RepID=UPI00391CF179